MNPTIAIANELIHKHNAQVVIMNTPEFKEKIEKIGAKYIEYEFYTSWAFSKYVGSKVSLSIMAQKLYDMAYYNMDQMIKVFKEEEPDFILYDKVALHAKAFYCYVSEQIKKGKLDLKLPPSISLSTTVLVTQNDLEKMKSKLSTIELIQTLWEALRLLLR
jgi:UDP:flavonoid glycosyltransferase YjiC (YdhE family)